MRPVQDSRRADSIRGVARRIHDQITGALGLLSRSSVVFEARSVVVGLIMSFLSSELAIF